MMLKRSLSAKNIARLFILEKNNYDYDQAYKALCNKEYVENLKCELEDDQLKYIPILRREWKRVLENYKRQMAM